MNNKLIWVVGLLAVLVAANLSLTAYLAFRSPTDASASKVVESSVISEAEAGTLAKDVIAHYNNRDSAALYQMFDPLARIQITQKQLADQTNRLQDLLGSVGEVVYSHAELVGTSDGKTYYALHYRVSMLEGPFQNGTLKLTVVQNKDNLGLFGFFLNGSGAPSEK